MLSNNELRAILNHVVGRYIRLEDCTETQRVCIDDLIRQRLTGIPLAKIIGYKEFWKHRFVTTEDTLDPRPDSETLIEAVLKTCAARPYRTLDLGTGTGCLLISLLHEYPEAMGVGVDISEKALEVAKQNAATILGRHSLEERSPQPMTHLMNCSNNRDSSMHDKYHPERARVNGSSITGSYVALVEDDRIEWVQSNWCEQLSGAFDIIVCNPPYIDPSEPINEGATFDPPLALYGGIHTYEVILQSIDKHLTTRPQHLFFEIGYSQAEAVSALLQRYGYYDIQIFKDLSGHNRVIYACT